MRLWQMCLPAFVWENEGWKADVKKLKRAALSADFLDYILVKQGKLQETLNKKIWGPVFPALAFGVFGHRAILRWGAAHR